MDIGPDVAHKRDAVLKALPARHPAESSEEHSPGCYPLPGDLLRASTKRGMSIVSSREYGMVPIRTTPAKKKERASK